MKKPRVVVINCTFGMGRIDFSDAYITSYCNMRKRPKKIPSKALPLFDVI
jgi:hypothetical protein